MSHHVDTSWQDIIEYAYLGLSPEYRDFLEKDKGYFPSYDNFLNAFKTLPLEQVKYILFGQDPYPREESAIGYAFIDGAVKTLFSPVSYTHLRAHETKANLVCRLLLEKKK